MRLAVACALLVCAHAGAAICPYRDADGKRHYSNVPPEQGWVLDGSCTAPLPEPGSKEWRAEQAAWDSAYGKIKIGMGEDQFRALNLIWARLDDRRTVESAGRREVWYHFADGPSVQVVNGRLKTIVTH